MKKARNFYLVLGLITAAIVASQDVLVQLSLNDTAGQVKDFYKMIRSRESADKMHRPSPLIAYTVKEEAR